MGIEARQEAARLIKGFIQQLGNDPQKAWCAVYRALLWHDDVAGELLPHIQEISALRQAGWANRARAVHSYCASALGMEPSLLPASVDRLMNLPRFKGLQRQNPLGEGFVGAVEAVLSTLGNPAIDYQSEVPSTQFFPGIQIPGRTTVPKIDLAATREGRLLAIISAKWSLRHDRLNDITNECPVYKEAAFRHWRRRPRYYVATNEFSPARLRRLSEDTCIDGVVHVHAPLVTDICGLKADIHDLVDLISLTHQW